MSRASALTLKGKSQNKYSKGKQWKTEVVHRPPPLLSDAKIHGVFFKKTCMYVRIASKHWGTLSIQGHEVSFFEHFKRIGANYQRIQRHKAYVHKRSSLLIYTNIILGTSWTFIVRKYKDSAIRMIYQQDTRPELSTLQANPRSCKSLQAHSVPGVCTN